MAQDAYADFHRTQKQASSEEESSLENANFLTKLVSHANFIVMGKPVQSTADADQWLPEVLRHVGDPHRISDYKENVNKSVFLTSVSGNFTWKRLMNTKNGHFQMKIVRLLLNAQ